ncbi:MAG: SRPBCC domain-containing protein [Pseudolabrys sp.]
MSKTIDVAVDFKQAKARQLYDDYLNAKAHSDIIGAPVTVAPKIGAAFSAFGGGLSGRILELVPGRMIVQSWRGQPWRTDDLDSTLVLTFEDTAKGARIRLVHANIPEQAAEMVNEQKWDERYWTPWKTYLRRADG